MRDEEILIGLATIVVFGVGSQWVGRRAGIPSLLLLLPAGVLAGPVLGLVEPEELFGSLLFPGITLLVSLLLFQAALGLRLANLPRKARGPVLRLVTVGAAVTFVGAAAGAGVVLGLPRNLAFLTAAVLVVSGPTVVGPLLRSVRPKDPGEGILIWESTALDPIGATLGVVVLNLVVAPEGDLHPVLQMLGRLSLGVTVGCGAALLLVLVMSRFYVTDEMEAAVALLFAVAAFVAAEVLLSEAGLFATTTLGFIAANQDFVPTARISGFGDTLEVLIIGSLFIVLGALVDLDALGEYAWKAAVFVVLLVVVVRPVSVALALVRTPLDLRERAFVGAVDPRGIVAAATAAQFTGSLDGAGVEHSFLLPVVFGVIVGTGVFYATTAGLSARVLGMRRAPAKGVAVVGNEPWGFELARCLQRLGVPVLVFVTGERAELAVDDVPSASLFDDEVVIAEAVGSASISQAVVVARPDSAVVLITANLVELLGRHHVHDVRSDSAGHHRRTKHATAHAFGAGVTRARIDALVASGASVRATTHAPDGDGLLLAAVATDGTVDLEPRAKTFAAGTTIIGIHGSDRGS